MSAPRGGPAEESSAAEAPAAGSDASGPDASASAPEARSYDDVVPGSLAWIAATRRSSGREIDAPDPLDEPPALPGERSAPASAPEDDEHDPVPSDQARRDERQEREAARAQARQAAADAKAVQRREREEQREAARRRRAEEKQARREQKQARREERRRAQQERREAARRDEQEKASARRRAEARSRSGAAVEAALAAAATGAAPSTAVRGLAVPGLTAAALTPAAASTGLATQPVGEDEARAEETAVIELDEPTVVVSPSSLASPSTGEQAEAAVDPVTDDPSAREDRAVAARRRSATRRAKAEQRTAAKAERARRVQARRDAVDAPAGADEIVPEPPALPRGRGDGAGARSLLAGAGVVIGVVGLLCSVLLAIAALLVAFGFDTDGGPLGALATVCDPLVGPLRGLVSFSGDGAAMKEAFVSYGAGSVVYLVVGVAVPSLLRRPRD